MNYSDILIGYFEPLLADNSDYPFADGTHFMLVNGTSTSTAAQSAQWYHLTFDFGQSGFDSLQFLSRATGQVEDISLVHLSGSQYALDWNLEGGTGDLFRFANSGALNPPDGDFNADHSVDAADYVAWRKGLGTAYSPNDYQTWRAHFGENDGNGAGAALFSDVPESQSRIISLLAINGTARSSGWMRSAGGSLSAARDIPTA